MNSELIVFKDPNSQLDYDLRIGKGLAASGMFPDAKTQTQAVAKIIMGRNLGLTPMQAMTGIHIVEGKPEVGATLLASFVRQTPDVRYAVVQHQNEVCELHFFENTGEGDETGRYRHAQSCPDVRSREIGGDDCICNPSRQRAGEEFLGVSRFDQNDVAVAELDGRTSKGKEKNHTKYPRNMKFARAMSNGVKWYCPEATGGIAVYHEGEIEVSRILDAPAPESMSVADVVASLPAEHRDRFWAAWGDAQDLRHGQVTVANAQMSLAGQEPEKVVAWLERVEHDNDVVRTKRDIAKVFDVPEEYIGPVEADVVDGDEAYHPDPGQASDVAGPDEERIASLNVRLSGLYDIRDADATTLDPDAWASLGDEIDMVEGMIRAAGGDVP